MKFSFITNIYVISTLGVPYHKSQNIHFYLVYKSFSLFFFGCVHGMWKFLGQGSNPCHSSSQSYCSDSAGSLTCYATDNFKDSLML